MRPGLLSTEIVLRCRPDGKITRRATQRVSGGSPEGHPEGARADLSIIVEYKRSGAGVRHARGEAENCKKGEARAGRLASIALAKRLDESTTRRDPGGFRWE